MTLPKIKFNRKNLTLVSVLIIALSIPLTVVLLGIRQELRKKAVTEAQASVGYAPFINAGEYGAPGAEAGAQAGAQPEVQNLQPPTISGFSSDLFTGGATVNYPLDLPPGRGGLTPSLSLNYSSHSVYGPVVGMDANGQNGHNDCDIIHCGGGYDNWTDHLVVQSSQIGLGWDIGGLGYVFRDSTNRYTLVLNGQSYRLFKTLREAGSAEELCEDKLGDDKVVHVGEWNPCTGKWHTDPESFLKIRHTVRDADEPDGNGPPAPGVAPKVDSFTIYDTNGTYYEFSPRVFFLKRCDCRYGGSCRQDPFYCGDAAEEKWATSYTTWVLTKVRDVHSNEIDFTYAEERREVNCTPNQASDPITYEYPRAVYPSAINYSNTKVEFELADRDDWRNLRWASDSCNEAFYSTKRISKINIKVKQGADWKIVRQYELDNDQYFTRPGDDSKKLHPKLTKITAWGRDGTSLPPYTFDYVNDPQDWAITNHRLLKVADNGYGGKVTYNYESYGADDYDPNGKWWWGVVYGLHRVTEKTAEDGRGNSFKTTYVYAGPRGIAGEKHAGFESVGHSLVTETVYEKNSTQTIRQSKYYFRQGEYVEGQFFVWPERGRLWKTEIFDKDGKLLSSAENDYLREPNDEPLSDSDPNNNNSYTNCARDDNQCSFQDTIWNTAHFIATRESRACQDPTSPSSVGSKVTYEYNKDDQNGQQWGNLTQTTVYRMANMTNPDKPVELDCNSPSDLVNAVPYRATHNTYFPNLDSHITNRVAETETFACGQSGFSALGDCTGAKRMGLVWNLYDDKSGNNPEQTPGSKGLLTLTRAFYTFPEPVGAAAGARPTVDTKYDYYDGNPPGELAFGGLKATTTYDGYNQSGTARVTTIEYEDTYNTFPDKTINPLLHTTETYYRNGTTLVNHPYLADRTVTKDVNNQQWTTVVDGFGRTKETLVPGEGSTAQTKVDYNDVNKTTVNPLIVHTQTRDDKDDDPNKITYQHSWQFYNGLGQVIESQAEHANDGVKVGEVPGITLTATEYNALGQAVKTLTPYHPNSNGGVYVEHDWDTPSTLPLHSQAVYDSLGRITNSKAPSKSWSASQLDNPTSWYETQTGYYGRKTAALDPKNHLATTEVDNLGRAVNTRVFTGNRSLGTPDDYYAETKFQYDNLDRLTRTIDTKGNITENFYNQFGQKTSSKDPDLGNWSYTYYPTGTLKTVKDAKQQVASFRYDILDRVTDEYYGDIGSVGATNKAWLGYDSSCPNGIGKLCFHKTYSNGPNRLWQNIARYEYDVKGRLQSETKHIDINRNSIEDPDETFVTAFSYDAAGRQRTITYPDGTHETVTYAYNDAGLLKNVAGASTYLSSAKYNVLGQPEEEVLGNQTKNVYDYEDNTHRLESLVLKDKNGAALWFQNPFVYDKVGNILNITSPDPANPLQSITYTYSYDDLNRLVGMTSAGPTSTYDYDQLGRMTLKTEEGGEAPPPECVPGKENPDLPGDLDCDCRVSIVDIMKVAAIWGTRQGDAGFNPDYDFVSDGRISVADIMYVAAKWRTECP